MPIIVGNVRWPHLIGKIITLVLVSLFQPTVQLPSTFLGGSGDDRRQSAASPYEVNRESCLGGTFSTVLLMRIFRKQKTIPPSSHDVISLASICRRSRQSFTSRLKPDTPKKLSLNGFDLFQKPAITAGAFPEVIARQRMSATSARVIILQS